MFHITLQQNNNFLKDKLNLNNGIVKNLVCISTECEGLFGKWKLIIIN